MSQDHDDIFEETVIAAERQARSGEAGYKWRLLAFGLLGYFVIFGALLLLLGLVGGVIAAAAMGGGALIFLLKSKAIFGIIPACWVLFQSLRLKITNPTGYTLTRDKCPELFNVLDELTSKLKTPPIHQVILERNHNAAIAQTSKWGIMGRQKNTLFLGLELLMVMTPAQAKSVVAHELGHLSANHNRFSSWVYRLRSRWLDMQHALEEQKSWSSTLMAMFFNWYAPRFCAYSFVLARTQEYEADHIAAELTSAQDAADALVTSYVVADYVDTVYWDHFFEQADHKAEPEHMPWQGLSQFLHQHQVAADDLAERLDKQLDIRTDYGDSHPSLRDRLHALNVSAKVPAPAKHTAAKQWLGLSYQSIVDDFDAQWYEGMAERWKKRYESVLAKKRELATLLKAEPAALSDDQLWRKAVLTEELKSLNHAAKSYLAYYQRQPEQAKANYALARVCYEQKKARLFDFINKAARDPDYALDAFYMAWQYQAQAGEHKDAAQWQQKYNNESHRQRLAWQNIVDLSEDDSFRPLKSDDEQAQQLLKLIRHHRLVKRAFVAEKVVPHAQHLAPFVVTVETIGWFGEEEKAEKLERYLNQEIEREVYVIARDGENAYFGAEAIRFGQQAK